MTDKVAKDPGGRQPEFVSGLEAAAEAGGQKPAGQSETAIPATEPQSSSLEHEQARAADVLKRNTEKDTGSPA